MNRVLALLRKVLNDGVGLGLGAGGAAREAAQRPRDRLLLPAPGLGRLAADADLVGGVERAVQDELRDRVARAGLRPVVV